MDIRGVSNLLQPIEGILIDGRQFYLRLHEIYEGYLGPILDLVQGELAVLEIGHVIIRGTFIIEEIFAVVEGGLSLTESFAGSAVLALGGCMALMHHTILIIRVICRINQIECTRKGSIFNLQIRFWRKE